MTAAVVHMSNSFLVSNFRIFGIFGTPIILITTLFRDILCTESAVANSCRLNSSVCYVRGGWRWSDGQSRNSSHEFFMLFLSSEKNVCSSEEFTCKNTEGECIPMAWVCDQNEDCTDKSDEAACSKCEARVAYCARHQWAVH